MHQQPVRLAIHPLFRGLRALLFSVLALVAGMSMAQVDNVYVYGTVKDYNTSKKLDAVTVTVLKNGVKSNSVVTSANGKYEFNLDYGYEYKLLYEKAGMVGKNVVIDTRGIPEEERVGGLAMNVEMTLFQDIPGIDYSILDQPIGKSKYDGGQGMLSWDLAYTEQMRAELNRLQKEYDEKKKKEANADAAFQKLMDQGNAAMTAKDYKKAAQSFTDALGIKPGDAVATARLSDAQMRLGELERAAQRDKQYADLVKEADAFFGKKSYEEAKAKYAAALQIKEEETYPKQRIKECDGFLAAKAEEERKAKELEEAFQAAVKAGDAAFNKADYATAQTKYNEALGLKPKEKYPADQLAAIAKKMEELAKKAEEDRKAAELEAAFQAAIKAGDEAFKAAQYEEARTKYNEALALKPKEKYPADQLAAITKKLAELAKQAEEERKAKELDAAYQAAVAAADAAFHQEDYDGAKKKYNEALALKPKEKYPADQLALIAKAVADKAKKAEEERLAAERDAKYQGLMDQAEALFAQEKYADAKARFTEAGKVKPAEPRPKERIVEIDALLAQKARDAEAQRKQAELDARYNALIASADKKYDAGKHADALNDYKDASGLKPEEQYPKDRIAAINDLLDAKAKEAAEKERLAREAAERDRRYNDLVAQADKDFKGKAYEAAIAGYGSALEVKPDEEYPAKKLEEARQMLEAQAAAERDKAAREAAERARLEEEARKKAEADSLKAARDAEERARLEAERAGKEQAAAELRARYDQAVARADAAFRDKAWDDARTGYQEALGLMPKEKYPKDQLAALEKAIKDQAKADKDALARAEAERLAEQERLRKEREEADALAQAQRQRESQRALDERYAGTIRDADQAMAGKDYSLARELYTQALDIKPDESYPQVKIDQIEKLEAELAKQRKLREQAERRQEVAAAPPVSSGSMDSRKEQEAEEFMREAREREEAEKYGRVKRLKAQGEEQADAWGGKAGERHEQARQRQDQMEGAAAGLYQGSEALRLRHIEEVEALKEANARRMQAWNERGQQQTDASYARVQDQEADQRQRQISLQQDRRTAQAGVREQEWLQYQADLAKAGGERSDKARENILDEQQRIREQQQQHQARAERNQEAMDNWKQGLEAREKMVQTAALERQQGNEARINEILPDQQRSFDNFARNELASQYPQGVTEESYTEGNKVIIRRVLVQGNKADEYSKVIAKWGTFYFKNGQSITEHIWTVNTER